LAATSGQIVDNGKTSIARMEEQLFLRVMQKKLGDGTSLIF
jgi:hypothetical protein